MSSEEESSASQAMASDAIGRELGELSVERGGHRVEEELLSSKNLGRPDTSNLRGSQVTASIELYDAASLMQDLGLVRTAASLMLARSDFHTVLCGADGWRAEMITSRRSHARVEVGSGQKRGLIGGFRRREPRGEY